VQFLSDGVGVHSSSWLLGIGYIERWCYGAICDMFRHTGLALLLPAMVGCSYSGFIDTLPTHNE
jgi:hypothetical protein